MTFTTGIVEEGKFDPEATIRNFRIVNILKKPGRKPQS